MTNPRRAGVLLHPTSLPGPYGIGSLGEAAHRFVDWLAACRLSSWQVLPLVPPGPGNSPYSSQASFAGSPWLVDLDLLAEAGLLAPSDLSGFDPHGDDAADRNDPARVDFAAMEAFKAPRLLQAAAALLGDPGHAWAAALHAFQEANPWVAEAALFAALHGEHERLPWWDWPATLRDRDPAALDRARARLAAEIDGHTTVQFFFAHQWEAVRVRCAEAGIEVIGDLPIYVDHDSVDVWAHRDQFQLDADGKPLAVAGVPPDYFSETGQLWGNPIYDWAAMARDGHAWWVARVRAALERYDRVRLDHFRGFAAYWAIPPNAEDARPGAWEPGPGHALFDDLERALGSLPLIAEDLGVIDEPVRELRDSLGLPGMKVLQFAFHGTGRHPFLPHHHRPNAVVYTGTHDNDTTVGWWLAQDDGVRRRVLRYLGAQEQEAGFALVRAAFASVAETAIIPLQDLLFLDGRARMNVPAEPEGNWGWRMDSLERLEPLRDDIRELCALFDRENPLDPDPPAADEDEDEDEASDLDDDRPDSASP